MHERALRERCYKDSLPYCYQPREPVPKSGRPQRKRRGRPATPLKRFLLLPRRHSRSPLTQINGMCWSLGLPPLLPRAAMCPSSSIACFLSLQLVAVRFVLIVPPVLGSDRAKVTWVCLFNRRWPDIVCMYMFILYGSYAAAAAAAARQVHCGEMGRGRVEEQRQRGAEWRSFISLGFVRITSNACC